MATIQTYRLVVEEDDANRGLDVELRDEEEGLIVETTRLDYESYGLEPAADADRSPNRWEREITTDADVLELEVNSLGDDFTVAVVGGASVERSAGEPDVVGKTGDGAFARLRLTADDLDLTAA